MGVNAIWNAYNLVQVFNLGHPLFFSWCLPLGILLLQKRLHTSNIPKKSALGLVQSLIRWWGTSSRNLWSVITPESTLAQIDRTC